MTKSHYQLFEHELVIETDLYKIELKISDSLLQRWILKMSL